MTNLGPMAGQLVHFKRFASAGNGYAPSRYRTRVHRLFEFYDQRLAERPWVGGEEHGIADIAAFPLAAQCGDAARPGAPGVRPCPALDHDGRRAAGGGAGAGRGGPGARRNDGVRQGGAGEPRSAVWPEPFRRGLAAPAAGSAGTRHPGVRPPYPLGGSRYSPLCRYRRSQNRASTPIVAATGTASITPRKPKAAPPANSAKITHTAGSSTRSPRKRG